jgi:hypothetical protein
MAKNFEKLIFGGLHEKHAVQRGIWVPTQHLLWDQGKPRKTLIELGEAILEEHQPNVGSTDCKESRLAPGFDQHLPAHDRP